MDIVFGTRSPLDLSTWILWVSDVGVESPPNPQVRVQGFGFRVQQLPARANLKTSYIHGSDRKPTHPQNPIT